MSVPGLARACLPATGLALAGAAALLLLTARPPAPEEPVVLTLAPWAAPEAPLWAVAALGGRLVAPAAFDFAVIAAFDRAVTLTELRRHGIWLAFPAVSSSCLPPADHLLPEDNAQ